MPKTMRIEIDGLQEVVKALEEAGLNVEEVLTGAVLAAGEVIASEANPNAPSPNVVAQVDSEESSNQRVVVNVGPDQEHWYHKFAETGASAHEIEPHKGFSLVFQGRGGLVMTKSVQHPGVAAKPFLRPALTSGKNQAVEEVGKHVKGALE